MWGPGPDEVDVIFEKLDQSQVRRLAMEDDPALSHVRGYDTWKLTIRRSEVQAIRDEIYEAIDDRSREGHIVNRLVLGDEQYVRLKAAALYASDHREGYRNTPASLAVEELLPVDDIIVVPGSMIEPVIENRFRVDEYHDRQCEEDQ